ncbi:MAG TPA: LysR family transcriptional regulator [Pseudolabrys sp.]|jgi:DNA-binding transcriptional LysR family regulator
MSTDGRVLGGIGVLAAVVEARSFVGAARGLNLTQSGISRAVARLEQRVGVRLFERNARAVTLTDDGRRFYEKVAPLLSELDQAVTDVGRASTAVRGALRVSINPLVARFMLAPRLTGFLAAHPELSLDLTVRDDAGGLVAEGFDAAVRFGEPALQGQIVRRLLETRVVTCASPAYLTRHGRPRRPQDLEQHECIQFPDPATGRPFSWEFHRKGRIVKVQTSGRLTINDGDMMVMACEQGHGIVQSLEFAAPGLHDGRLIDLFPEWNGERFPLYVHFPSRRQQPAKVRAFVEFVADAVR